LFTGDIEKQTERELLLSSGNLSSDVLKVAHHGSKTSSSESFLQSVHADFFVISAGPENRFGHPHAQVVEKLVRSGGRIFITRDYGDIDVFSDGADTLWSFERPR
jgi:competence protein ComEC